MIHIFALIVQLSNLNRQILYSINDLNKKKVEVAKKKLQGINPNCNIYDKKQLYKIVPHILNANKANLPFYSTHPIYISHYLKQVVETQL